MRVLVDTSVWSLALRRRKAASAEANVLAQLIREDRAHMIGAIRQEILSGVSDQQVFTRLAEQLAAFPDLPLHSDDYVVAATYCNACRSKGIQGSNTDFLIFVSAVPHDIEIYTTDKDFRRFATHIPITLFSV